MTDIAQILTERGERYGDFGDCAAIAQALKQTMRSQDRWYLLDASQKEALEMVQHKIARILNGDPDYADSWRDGAGYFTLVADRIEASKS